MRDPKKYKFEFRFWVNKTMDRGWRDKRPQERSQNQKLAQLATTKLFATTLA